MQKRKLSIAIPASVVSDTPHLREKTSKIGLIGRAAAIFRVDKIMIYPDNLGVDQTTDMELVSTLLGYMETPQYLRKRLFKLRPELQYAGILPPLRTPHHPLNRRMKSLKVSEYREGVIVSRTREGALVDIGVEKPALIRNEQLLMGKRVSVKIVTIGDQVEVEMADRDQIPVYWGYKVIVKREFIGRITESRGNFDLTIATSKYGTPLAEVAEKIAERWKKAQSILLAFGSPMHGLYEILKNEGLNLNDAVDFVANTIPNQGTETVRTEEALIASLAIFNMQFNL